MYNTLASPVTFFLSTVYNVNQLVAFFGFVVVYDTVFAFVLVRKLRAYRRAYSRAHTADDGPQHRAEQTEFEP